MTGDPHACPMPALFTDNETCVLSSLVTLGHSRDQADQALRALLDSGWSDNKAQLPTPVRTACIEALESLGCKRAKQCYDELPTVDLLYIFVRSEPDYLGQALKRLAYDKHISFTMAHHEMTIERRQLFEARLKLVLRDQLPGMDPTTTPATSAAPPPAEPGPAAVTPARTPTTTGQRPADGQPDEGPQTHRNMEKEQDIARGTPAAQHADGERSFRPPPNTGGPPSTLWKSPPPPLTLTPESPEDQALLQVFIFDSLQRTADRLGPGDAAPPLNRDQRRQGADPGEGHHHPPGHAEAQPRLAAADGGDHQRINDLESKMIDLDASLKAHQHATNGSLQELQTKIAALQQDIKTAIPDMGIMGQTLLQVRSERQALTAQLARLPAAAGPSEAGAASAAAAVPPKQGGQATGTYIR